MSRELSSYLDFLRFMAAFAVLVAHMDLDGLYMSWFALSEYSHEAVVVFFVLSGFIVYSTTAKSGRSAKEYLIARAARIYSVSLLAVVASFIAAYLVAEYSPDSRQSLSNYEPPSTWNLVSSLLFLNESWLNPADLPLNDPYWSLCFEVWYYILFGIFLYVPGRTKWLALLLAACLAGPSIIALLPLWCFGAVLAREWDRTTGSLTSSSAALLFVASIAVVVGINISDVDIWLRSELKQLVPGFWRLEKSQRFVTDYLIGIAVVANIAAFPLLPKFIHRTFFTLQSVFSYLAGFSFTLYLFHRPMTQLLGHFAPNKSELVWYSLSTGGLVVALCLMISYATERQLAFWRALFRWIVLRSKHSST